MLGLDTGLCINSCVRTTPLFLLCFNGTLVETLYSSAGLVRSIVIICMLYGSFEPVPIFLLSSIYYVIVPFGV